MKFILPLGLIVISLAAFLVFISPNYNQIQELKTESASYDEALTNSKALEDQRDKLTAKYNAIDQDDLKKLQKLLPENVDNIRLVLEIGQLAAPYGMVLKNIKYNTTNDTTSAKKVTPVTPGAVGAVSAQGNSNPSLASSNKSYGVWDLGFSVVGTYNNFINFTKDLENNLRIVDVSSVQFSSSSGGATGVPGSTAPSAESYQYDFNIKTYWLKN